MHELDTTEKTTGFVSEGIQLVGRSWYVFLAASMDCSPLITSLELRTHCTEKNIKHVIPWYTSKNKYSVFSMRTYINVNTWKHLGIKLKTN